MYPKALINRLCSYQGLTVREAEQISHAGGTTGQSEKLLDCLLQKSGTAFEIFRDALRRTGQIYLEQLLGCEVYTYHFWLQKNNG